MSEFGIVIMRAQPFHNAHLELVRFALKEAQKVVIILGSANAPRDTMNPFTADQRRDMVRSCLTADELSRVEIISAKDYLSNNMWIAAVQNSVDAVTGGSSDIKLIGHKKDASSFYLKLFPQWSFHETGAFSELNATSVRENLFRQDKITIKTQVPKPVYDYLCSWMESAEYKRLHGEYKNVQEEHAAWEESPYVPTFVTTDAIVICSGHILIGRRGGAYGKDLLAWPGGYLEQDKSILDSCIRELREETKLKVSTEDLKKAVIDKDVFDDPRRDQRGRVITHAFCFKLPDGRLPEVQGADDMAKAWWMTINEFYTRELEFFADHFKMGCRFINRF